MRALLLLLGGPFGLRFRRQLRCRLALGRRWESASALRLWLRPSFDRAAAGGFPPLTLHPPAARGDSLWLYLYFLLPRDIPQWVAYNLMRGTTCETCQGADTHKLCGDEEVGILCDILYRV
jgi:hypothetical protein